MEINLKGEDFILYPEKAMLWKSRKTLFIADLHIGKAVHFRKAGIQIPAKAELNNLKLLEKLLLQSRCEKVIFLGDMFHSTHNSVCEKFILWRNNFPYINMMLIQGNHDILQNNFYKDASLTIKDELTLEPFIFTHKPLEDFKVTGYYNIAGHINLVVKLYGKGRQSLSLSCFYFGKTNGIMPSFGAFTGNCIVSPKEHDEIYVIANNIIAKVV